MDRRKTEIHQHQKSIDQLEASIQNQTSELGQKILARKKCELPELQELYNQGQQIGKEISKIQSKQKKIQQDQRSLQEIEEELKALTEEERIYLSNRRELVASIASNTYRVYSSGGLEDHEFENLFRRIDQLAREIEEKERQVQEIESQRQDKNILKKFTGTAKIGVLRKQILRQEKRQQEEFPIIGEKLLAGEMLNEIPDEQVQSLTTSLKQQEDSQSERDERRQELNTRRDSLEEELQSMIADSDPEKELRNLEQSLEQQQEKLSHLSLELGKAYLLQPGLEESVPEETKQVLDRIGELQAEKETHEKAVNNLQSQLEIEELQGEMKKKEEQIARLEKRIAEDKDYASQLKDELGSDNMRLQDLRRIVNEGDEQAPSEKDQ
ncbi:MAG TPA: hypothetical protein ENN41_01230 [Sediminispirochaeta sp.]|nr:hypothetical protein [Sediminispirochaeta sp.]